MSCHVQMWILLILDDARSWHSLIKPHVWLESLSPPFTHKEVRLQEREVTAGCERGQWQGQDSNPINCFSPQSCSLSHYSFLLFPLQEKELLRILEELTIYWFSEHKILATVQEMDPHKTFYHFIPLFGENKQATHTYIHRPLYIYVLCARHQGCQK